jgi:hypothetical protein
MLECGPQKAIKRVMMSTLELVPQGWFSWNFKVLEHGSPVAEIDMSSWGERGELAIAGAMYRTYRERALGGLFILESNGAQVATAEKPSAFQRSFSLAHEGKNYILKAASSFGRKFVLLDGEGNREIGSIRPAGVFTRKATLELPDELPLPVRVFVLWLTLILWKRQSED